MKKLALVTLLFALCATPLAVAAETQGNELVPSETLDEMIESGVNFSVDKQDADDHFGPGHGDHFRGAVCFAKNRRGQHFEARGRDAREAQSRVMQECRRVSRQCFDLGCRRG